MKRLRHLTQTRDECRPKECTVMGCPGPWDLCNGTKYSDDTLQDTLHTDIKSTGEVIVAEIVERLEGIILFQASPFQLSSIILKEIIDVKIEID